MKDLMSYELAEASSHYLIRSLLNLRMFDVDTQVVSQNFPVTDRIQFTIGNTGLRFFYNPEKPWIDQHYTPDGTSREAIHPVEQARKSTIYISGLYSFLLYIRERDNLKIRIAGQQTKKGFSDFMGRVIGSHYLALRSGSAEDGTDLMKFRFDLKGMYEDPALMKQFERTHAWMLRQKYRMANTVEECVNW